MSAIPSKFKSPNLLTLICERETHFKTIGRLRVYRNIDGSLYALGTNGGCVPLSIPLSMFEQSVFEDFWNPCRTQLIICKNRHVKVLLRSSEHKRPTNPLLHRISELDKTAFSCLRCGNETLAVFFFIQSLQMRSEFPGLIPKGHENLAHAYATFGSIKQAIHHFGHALNGYRILNLFDSRMATVLKNLGAIFLSLKRWKFAALYYKGALEIERKEDGDFNFTVACTVRKLAFVSMKSGDLPTAIHYSKLALSIAEVSIGKHHLDYENFLKAHQAIASNRLS